MARCHVEDDAKPPMLDESRAINDAYPRILRYARTLARDPAEAEDLTQEVFLRAFRARDTLHDPQAQLSWLYRIATHVWVDRVRQRTRRPQESETALEDSELADAGPGLQQVIEQSDMSACVQEYLVNLPDAYRAVLLLHDLHELPGPQIADMLDLSLATVKIRLHRARLKLRAALAAGCVFSHDERNVLVCEPHD
jgi:RNA polymerase sigma-70 factor, ECF subfamily